MLTLTQEQLVKIGEEYKNGESVLALSKKYECSTGAIKYRLNKLGISKIPQVIRLNPSLKEDYFEKIDDKNKAYWIGWILTDGCILSSNHLQISLLKNDGYILNLLEKDLGISNHVKIFNKNYIRFSLGSEKIKNDLAQYGAVPNKTLALKFPENIPKQFETHLLRGMFEGDGGLTLGTATRFYKHRNKSYTRPYRELSFTGTYEMCDGFQNTLLKYIDLPVKSITPNHSFIVLGGVIKKKYLTYWICYIKIVTIII